VSLPASAMRRFDPRVHHRRSIRLKDFDYGQAGAYFVTICTQDRACLFGAIVAGEMRANAGGMMVQAVWEALPEHYVGVELDAFVVMPNHVHGIILLIGRPDPNLPAGPSPGGSLDSGRQAPAKERPDQQSQQPARRREGQARGPEGQARGPEGQARGPEWQALGPAPTVAGPRACPVPGGAANASASLSLPDVMYRFKSLTTTKYSAGVRRAGWAPFNRRLWQRNYYEHVIRDEGDLRRIRAYVESNPGQWELDQLHPDNSSKW
jgi:putative transposase